MPLRLLPRLLLTLGLLAGLTAAAQIRPSRDPGLLPFTQLGPDDGLPTTGPIAIAQDAEGFIWLGAETGLIRYAQGQCRVYRKEEGLPSPFVSRILPARGGGLWLGTLEGLARFQGGKFQALTLPGTNTPFPARLLELNPAGRLVVATDTEVWEEGEDGTFHPLPIRGLGVPLALHLGRRSGWLYLLLPEGLRAFPPQGGPKFWGPAQGLDLTAPHLMVEDGQGRIWVGAGRNLRMKAPDSDRFIDRSELLPGSLSPNSRPLVEVDGTVWIPTQAGALHLLATGSEVLDLQGGLPFRWTRDFLRDREGSLWVLGASLARLQGAGRLRNYTLSGGAAGEMVWSILRDLDGSLLIGTDDGAARLGPGGLTRIPGSEGHRIKALNRDPLGNLWMASSTGPTLWLPAGRTRAEIAPLGPRGLNTHSVYTDHQRRVWVGHARYGLFRLDPATRKLTPEVEPAFVGAPTLSVYSFTEDSAGRLWAGSSAGLLVRLPSGEWLRFSEESGLHPGPIRGLAFLADGSAWVHHQSPRGLARVRLEGRTLDVLERRTQGHGLRSDMVYAVKVDGEGRVWASTDLGLDRLDPPLHVGRHDGMANEDCSVHALLIEGTRLWVGTLGGLVRFDAGPGRQESPPPAARILAAEFGTRRLELPFGPLPALSHADGTATFRVAAPSYVNEHDLRFQVRLAGLEEEWRDLEGRMARYPALAGGAYRFEVRAAQGAGAFGPVEGLDFRVRPPWWHTWWFRTLGLLTAGGLIYVAVRMRLAALARAKAALKVLVAERTAQLEARNEELSQALTRVKQLSGLLPICSCCKKIRDDRGYWNQLENYISSHSEADFTHGICPDCVGSLFPEVAQQRRKDAGEPN
jgi:ligand-binding sensor domain-containing protein